MSEKKKALLVTTVSGFVPQFEMNNVKILQDMGYDVHYAANYNTPVYTDNNDRLDGTGIIRQQVDFVRSPFRIIKNLKAYKQLRKVMKYDKYDLVHCHTPMGGVIGRIAAKRAKIPFVIYTAHGFHFYKGAPLVNWLLFYPIERILARITDVLITINKEDYCRARKFHIRKLGKVKLVHGVGIETTCMKTINKQEFRRSLDLKDDDVVFTSVGELTRRKNHKVTIRAMAKVTRNYKNVKYLICGTGRLEKYLKKIIIRLKLEENVKLMGYRTDVNEVLSVTECFLFPSLQEGLPVAVLEAMNMELPIICSNIRGNIDLVENFKGGYYCRKNSSEDYAKKINLILKDKNLGKQMGLRNKENLTKFDLKHISQNMKEIYSNLN